MYFILPKYTLTWILYKAFWPLWTLHFPWKRRLFCYKTMLRYLNAFTVRKSFSTCLHHSRASLLDGHFWSKCTSNCTRFAWCLSSLNAVLRPPPAQSSPSSSSRVPKKQSRMSQLARTRHSLAAAASVSAQPEGWPKYDWGEQVQATNSKMYVCIDHLHNR